MKTNNKELTSVIHTLKKNGYKIIKAKHNHIKIYDNNILKLILSSTPSDRRTIKNVYAQAKRRLGIELSNI